MFYKILILLTFSLGISTSQDKFRDPTNLELNLAQRFDEYTGRKKIINDMNKLLGQDDKSSQKLVCRDFGILGHESYTRELVYCNVLNITGQSISGQITWDHNFLPHFTCPSYCSKVSHIRVIQECYAKVEAYRDLGLEIRTANITSNSCLPMNLFLTQQMLVQLQITGGDWVIKNPPPSEKKLFGLTYSDSVNVIVMFQDKTLSRDESNLYLQDYRF